MASELALRIGARMRDRRNELFLTQRQVAARMRTEDLDPQRISDWERGYNKPSERYLGELVEALEVPDVSYFYEAPVRESETPDPFLDPDDAGVQAQLDRIERKLDEILKRLGPAQDEPGEAGEALPPRRPVPPPPRQPDRSPKPGAEDGSASDQAEDERGAA